MLTTFTTCNGSSNACDGSGTAVACTGGVKCASTTACLNGCGANSAAGDANCQSGWCDGVGVGACQAAQAAGSPCTRDAQCTTTCGQTTAGQCD
jgi:hypothetical protein